MASHRTPPAALACTAACLVSACTNQSAPDVHPFDDRSLLDATRLELTSSPSAQPYTFERIAPGRFRVLTPIKDLVAPALLADLARTWATATLATARRAGRDLRALGLDPPVGYVEAAWPDEAVRRVELGGTTVDGASTIWVRRGDAIHVGPLALLTSLQFEQERLRATAVFAHAVDEIAEVLLERRDGGGEMREVASVVRQDGAWRWRVQPPSAGSAAAFADAAAGLQRSGLRYGSPWPRKDADLGLRVRGKLGEEVLAVVRLADGRLLGWQDHRDVEVFLPADSPVLAVR